MSEREAIPQTCEVCGREVATKAKHDPAWCWAHWDDLIIDCDPDAAELNCKRLGYEREKAAREEATAEADIATTAHRAAITAVAALDAKNISIEKQLAEERAAREKAEAERDEAQKELRRNREREDALLADAYECERRARADFAALQARITHSKRASSGIGAEYLDNEALERRLKKVLDAKEKKPKIEPPQHQPQPQIEPHASSCAYLTSPPTDGDEAALCSCGAVERSYQAWLALEKASRPARPRCSAKTRKGNLCVDPANGASGLCTTHAAAQWNLYVKRTTTGEAI